MNLRSHVRSLNIRRQHVVQCGQFQRRIEAIANRIASPGEKVKMDAIQESQFQALWATLEMNQAKRMLVEPEPIVEGDPGVGKSYTVAKKATGEILYTFDSLAEAEEAILKAKKAKKAALVLA